MAKVGKRGNYNSLGSRADRTTIGVELETIQDERCYHRSRSTEIFNAANLPRPSQWESELEAVLASAWLTSGDINNQIVLGCVAVDTTGIRPKDHGIRSEIQPKMFKGDFVKCTPVAPCALLDVKKRRKVRVHGFNQVL